MLAAAPPSKVGDAGQEEQRPDCEHEDELRGRHLVGRLWSNRLDACGTFRCTSRARRPRAKQQRMAQASAVGVSLAALFVFGPTHVRAATLEPHSVVRGVEIEEVGVRAVGGVWRPILWDDLDRTHLEPGHYQARFEVKGDHDGGALEVPNCAGREGVAVDGRREGAEIGPFVVALSAGVHEVVLDLVVNRYESRIVCGDRPRFGTAVPARDGLSLIHFPSPSSTRGGGQALVYVPLHHDFRVPGPLLVGLHPWNGSIWTYAAYAPLLREAQARDVLLLMPSGLGNSLYTAEAEDEVMRAIDAVSELMAVDRRAVSLWGASMGGAGATTIGFHRPDRFASVTSFFGDSKYDLSTYAQAILPSEAAAHLVNALDVVDNARSLPVWLIHGEEDRTSPIRQSEILASQMRDRGFRVRFDRIPGMGHSGELVARFLPELVARAALARGPEHVTRVTYRSVRVAYTEVFGVRWARATSSRDAFVDVERRDDAVHVRRAEGVRSLALSRGAFGISTDGPSLPVVVDDADANARGFEVRWEP